MFSGSANVANSNHHHQVVPVVEKRAEKVAAEYVRKAQRTDQTYCGTAPGTVGPVEARLRTFDKTAPLVFGAFGEASSAVEQPLSKPFELVG